MSRGRVHGPGLEMTPISARPLSLRPRVNPVVLFALPLALLLGLLATACETLGRAGSVLSTTSPTIAARRDGSGRGGDVGQPRPPVAGVPPAALPTSPLPEQDLPPALVPLQPPPTRPTTPTMPVSTVPPARGAPASKGERPSEVSTPAGGPGHRCQAWTLIGALFDPDRAEIRPTAEPVLAKLAGDVASKRDPLWVDGHTDRRPTTFPGGNGALSTARAAAVAAWLVEHGIDAARINVHGSGSDDPLDAAESVVAYAKNRRVVVTVGCTPGA